MRSPAAERSLRRLVAKLATSEPDDVEQVLDALDAPQRAEVRALLDAYTGPEAAAPAVIAPTPPPTPVAAPDLSHLAGLSPALADRVASAERGDQGLRMTLGARSALVEAARALPAPIEPTTISAAKARGWNPFRRGRSSWA